jgi:EXLDI family protein
MPNKTIYVSQNDVPIFEEAQEIAGEGLSSVIARALREYVVRHQERDKSIREVSVKVGSKGSQREQRFAAAYLGKWKGLSEDKKAWLEATIYRTQKNNWALYLEKKGPSFLNKKDWQAEDLFEDKRYTELIVAQNPAEFVGKLPQSLITKIGDLAERDKSPIDYLDI